MTCLQMPLQKGSPGIIVVLKISENRLSALTCLPMVWKILTAWIMEDISFSLINRGLLLEDPAWEADEQESYYILMDTSLTRVKRDRKI